MADIRLLFNKSCAKKRRKINGDEEASKLLPPSTDNDEQHEAPVVIERESDETLQSETVVVGLDVAAQVGLPPSESESEYESETDGYGYDTLNRKKKITIVKATTWSRLMNAPVRNQLEKKMEMAITNSMRHRHSQSQLQVRMAMKIVAVFFSGSTGPPHR